MEEKGWSDERRCVGRNWPAIRFLLRVHLSQLVQKRLSKGRFRRWPSGDGPAPSVEAYQAQLLLAAGDPDSKAAPMWRVS